MFKSTFCFLILFIFSNSVVAEEEKLPPLDPGYLGVHGMVLMSKSSTVFASHLPLYHKPHNVQLIYKLDVKDFSILQIVRDNDLVTIKPKPFNLQRLMRGETMTINAELYIGHFERGGLKIRENITLAFTKQLYLRELSDIAVSSHEQVYDVVAYNSKSDRLYVHRLQQAPSYDHIIHIDRTSGCLDKFKTTTAVPKRTELQYKFMNCGTMKPMYFETQDFAK